MKWKQWGVDCCSLGIILFWLPSEMRPSTVKQKGSTASLTFPFSPSQLALGCPFISIDSCSLCCLWSRGELGAGWIWSAFCGYEAAHAGLISAGLGTDDELERCTLMHTHTIGETWGTQTHTHTFTDLSMYVYNDIWISRLESQTFKQTHTKTHVHMQKIPLLFLFFFARNNKLAEGSSPAERGLEWPVEWIMGCCVCLSVCLFPFACLCVCVCVNVCMGDPFCIFVWECFCVSAPPAAPPI